MSRLTDHLLADYADAERASVELQTFAQSKGLTPDMMRAIVRGRTNLGADSLGRLLLAVEPLHVCGRRPGALPDRFVPACEACCYELETFAYLRECGSQPRIQRPRQNHARVRRVLKA